MQCNNFVTQLSEGETKGRDQSRMGRGKVVILLIEVLFASCIKLDLTVEARASPSEREIEAKLNLINKPAVKTIKSEDGDIIDCVDIYKQPAFDHPALKNHTILPTPNFFRESRNVSQPKSVVFQKWQKSGSCPKGTVPIRRIRKEDLLRSASDLDRFGMTPPPHYLFKNSTNLHFPSLNTNVTTNDLIFPDYNSAAYLVTMGYLLGASADINIWSPYVDLPDDFTTGQIWLMAANGPFFESVESGWVVNPKLYGDRSTRLFGYWTTDSYRSTGCFDLTCKGFVQKSQKVGLGAAMQQVSAEDGQQYDISVGIYMDGSGNWWLQVQGEYVGYWPAELFRSIRGGAISAEWGGLVVSSKVLRSPHTATRMGSGAYATGEFKHSCYMRNVRVKDSVGARFPEYVALASSEPNCYNANIYTYGGDGVPFLFFGGPGRSAKCP